MAGGLFELRKDPITGWWVATVVDRAFHRDRFARAADPVDDHLFGCANCSTPPGDGVRTRMLKDFAFHVVGTDDQARELDRDHGLAQVSLAQARAMYARVATATGAVTPANVVALGETGLRAIGVTRQKSAYLAALATQLEGKSLDLEAIAMLSDTDAAAALDALHGVGPWTAHCYLLFALRRADVFPAADLALMESVRQLWRLRERPSSEALARRARAWRPHRAVAARLLWHHYLSERGRS